MSVSSASSQPVCATKIADKQQLSEWQKRVRNELGRIRQQMRLKRSDEVKVTCCYWSPKHPIHSMSPNICCPSALMLKFLSPKWFVPAVMGQLVDMLSAFSALTLFVGWQEGHPVCKKTDWWVSGMVVCLGCGADSHMAQLMPLSLTVFCSSKSRLVLPSGFYLFSTGSPG